jgi:hypothetical protein
MFAGAESMAVVGNADTVLDYESGSLIDACDLVVRFNKAHVTGIESKVGRRTDILVANRRYSLERAPPPGETLQPRCLACFIEPDRGPDPVAWGRWAGAVPTFVTLAPDLLGAIQVERTRPVTSGTSALYCFVHMLPIKRLFVTGFTFYGAAGVGPGNYWEELSDPRGLFHDLEAEARIFVSILERFKGKLEVTPEVQELMRRFGTTGKEAGPSRALLEGIAMRAGWSLIRAGMVLRRQAERRRRGAIRRGRP